MKLSRFLHIVEDSSDSVLLLNTLSGKLYKFSGKAKEMLLSFYGDSPCENCTDVFLEFLFKEEIVVDDSINEDARAELKFHEMAHGNGKLLLTLLPTEDCNFRCPYCYEAHNKGNMSQEIVESIKRYIDKNLCYYRMLQVNWFGGEPLEALDIIEDLSNYFLKKCAEQKKPYRASMTTNGYNLSLDIFKKLYGLHVLDYQITLDGFAETHNKNRYFKDGSGTYEVILNNLYNIRDLIKTRNFHVTIRTNITKSIMKNIEEFIQFINDEFGNDLRFGVLYKIAWSNNKQTVFNDTELLPTGELHKVLAYCEKTKLSFNINRGQICAQNGICYAAFSNAFIIGADGQIYKCTVEFDKDVNHIGRLDNTGKIVLDKDKLAFWIMKTPFKGSFEKCSQCYFQPACMGRYCPINCFDEAGNHRCVGMKDYVDIYMRLCSHTPQFIQEVIL